jgi:hypothetical protein
MVVSRVHGRLVPNGQKGCIDPDYRKFLGSGVEYALRPINTSETYARSVKDNLVLKAGYSVAR